MVFGKLARERSSEPLSQQEKLQTYDDYLIHFVTQLHEMRTQARENIISAKEKSKLYYDKKINPLEVNVGDNVFLLKGSYNIISYNVSSRKTNDFKFFS